MCNPRKIVRRGNKADKLDAKLLAELLRAGALKPVYRGEKSTRAVKELALSYVSVVADGTRIKNRLKALFRGRGIECGGTAVYSLDERNDWLAKLDSAAVCARAARLWQELDCVERLSEEAAKELAAEARKNRTRISPRIVRIQISEPVKFG